MTDNGIKIYEWPYIQDGKPRHVNDLVGKLRESDANEIIAITKKDPDEMLRRCWENSLYRWAVVWKRRAICLYGLHPLSLMGRTASPWMLATDELAEVRRPFAKHCRGIINDFLKMYPRLFNWVDARNEVSIKWLKWMGFTMSDKPFPYGAERRLFYFFEKHKEDC